MLVLVLLVIPIFSSFSLMLVMSVSLLFYCRCCFLVVVVKINEIGSRISSKTGDCRRLSTFLFQRLSLSVSIQRLNLVAFQGTFLSLPEDEV